MDLKDCIKYMILEIKQRLLERGRSPDYQDVQDFSPSFKSSRSSHPRSLLTTFIITA